MKEFGDTRATRANLLCTNTYCELNSGEGDLLTASAAKSSGRKHDKLTGHEAVLVYHDNDHPLTPEVGGQVMVTTGVVII